MAYRAIDVAQYIINHCNMRGIPISNLKLQKLLYFLWVDYYKATGKELFYDEISAWQLGPVVLEVYYEYCAHAGRPITTVRNVVIDDEDRIVIDAIIDRYSKMRASSMVDLTHREGTPWSVVYKNGHGIRDTIDFSLIKELECR